MTEIALDLPLIDVIGVIVNHNVMAVLWNNNIWSQAPL